MHGMHGWFGFRPAFAGAHCGPRGRGPCGGSRHAPHPGPHEEWHHSYATGEHDGGFGAGAFGVRRPLRVMARRLGLDEAQIAELARILDDLKTERAQAAVDHRRAVGAFADAFTHGDFDEAKVKEAAELRTKSAERVQGAVVEALRRTHAMLDEAQRKELAYLLRSGALTI